MRIELPQKQPNPKRPRKEQRPEGGRNQRKCPKFSACQKNHERNWSPDRAGDATVTGNLSTAKKTIKATYPQKTTIVKYGHWNRHSRKEIAILEGLLKKP
ncbi:MAG TPA: hypothetical protein DEE98_00110 [Elusimicrobia bacterium]|nr:MAG: hypothetical protein A2278_03805 [Elusimicrobia bacterium RIFOXYA12_FULL_49_49]OGS08916.1 MAG: hypothetical protein A2204_00770 [Elusimicrobia bacterium RIFOXYA1_FULL_47_7]OGS09509.1 MAG: hypothetical protein A2386_00960 [Elusimicrobia bacterium RIFOXYB1_FULL_48_9]OGS15287.1 MAG: hypothetical protein A2251_07120 [Elusimicrobia bacterium RIFOXYA2_FULL_47_53]OGS26559.1 MAG: hypothetical protein A2339_07000 [Elusimicrobia bacterium RIFOXYB12_FULL_50_12]OGS30542.1 MAG: hypothetical protein